MENLNTDLNVIDPHQVETDAIPAPHVETALIDEAIASGYLSANAPAIELPIMEKPLNTVTSLPGDEMTIIENSNQLAGIIPKAD